MGCSLTNVKPSRDERGKVVVVGGYEMLYILGEVDGKKSSGPSRPCGNGRLARG
jgi:hypothetical protein